MIRDYRRIYFDLSPTRTTPSKRTTPKTESGLCFVRIVTACADGVQCAIFDDRRIAFALARNCDDGCGDNFSDRVVSICEAKIE